MGQMCNDLMITIVPPILKASQSLSGFLRYGNDSVCFFRGPGEWLFNHHMFTRSKSLLSERGMGVGVAAHDDKINR